MAVLFGSQAATACQRFSWYFLRTRALDCTRTRISFAGLEFIHSKGVVHRDIALRNILMKTGRFEFMIADLVREDVLYMVGGRDRTVCSGHGARAAGRSGGSFHCL